MSIDQPHADASTLAIDSARLFASLEDLKSIGSYHDEVSGLTGVNRLALTDADAAGRRQVVAWMEQAGLVVSIDGIGNAFGRRPGREDALAPVMIGSHIDSVPTAGAFDGALGVLGGLEVVRTLNDAGLTTLRPLVVAFFSEEEGCRFGTDMLGSAVASGRISLSDAHVLTDRDGLSVGEELQRIGFRGDAPSPSPPHAYLECHIEQGPILGRTGMDIGVVQGVQAISWHELTLMGRSAHAGTTPTDYRRDAGLALARITVELQRMVESGEYGEMRATIGKVALQPGAVNVVAGRADCTVDLRNPDDAAMAAAEQRLFVFLDELQQQTGVEISHRQTAKTDSVRFDSSLGELITDAAGAQGCSHAPILSGAGHDAQEWARVTRAGMIFVPGENDGISHNPREFSTEQQCAHGVNVLLRVVTALAAEE
jgi:N-carbamoyl-L-amino-acid hydrolase